MSTSRRNFIKASAYSVAATTLFSNRLFASAPRATEMLGVQLFSVRDKMNVDPAATLKQVADIGYKYVEHANYVNRKFYKYDPKDFKKLLDDLNLKMASGHTVLGKQHWDAAKNDFSDSWKYTVEDAAVAGQKYVISPWLDASMRQNMDDFKRYMDVFNKSGELCKKSGMKFGYHNHDFEFNTQIDGKKLYDLILQFTDPNLVIQQLDIGNLYNGGGVAMEIVKQYPGRFESMHVKDEIKGTDGKEKYESTILGTGIVNTKEVIDAGRKNGTVHFIIEQESYQGKGSVESCKEDFDIMKKWGY